MMASEISLHELYGHKDDWDKAVVLKDFPVEDTVDIEHLENFLDVILGEDADLKAVCCSVQSSTAVIAVFDKTLEDTRKYVDKLVRKSYKKKTLRLEKLGGAVGVFLPSVPFSVNKEFITLYFESEKRCGWECDVTSVKVKAGATSNCAAVIIYDEKAVETVLAKSGHVMKDLAITLEPYFPAYHDYVMENMVEGAEKSTTWIQRSHEDEDHEEKTTSVKQLKDQFESQRRNSDQPSCLPISVKPIAAVPPAAPRQAWLREPDIFTPEEPVLVREHVSDVFQASESKEHSPTTEFDNSEYFGSPVHTGVLKTDIEVPRRSPSNDSHKIYASQVPEPKKPANLFDCIIDGLDDVASNSGAGRPQNTQTLEDNQTPFRPNTSPPVAPKPRQKPRSREKRNYPDNRNGEEKDDDDDDGDDDDKCHVIYSRNDENVEQRNYQGQGKPRQPRGGKGKGKLGECEDVPVMVAKIILLRITKYNLRPSDNVSVFLDEKLSKVVIRGASKADITAEKLRLYEALEKICERTEKYSVPMSSFLCQREVLGQLRYICKQEKLKVAVHVTANQQTLHCLAFTEDEANKGLKTIKDKLQMKHVTLRDGQLDLFRGQKWSEVMEQLRGSLGTVYISEDKSRVMVEGFTGKAVENTRKKVVEFLKENVVKITTKLELHGAEARCFQKFMQHSLERTIGEKHGHIKVEVVKADYPMKLRLTVDGDDSAVKEAKTCLDQIWHEKIDFRKISDNDLDIWLMMKALTGEHGKPFFKKFQQEHRCFINVTEEGKVPPPERAVKQEQVHERRDSPPEPRASRSPPMQRRPRWSDHQRELKPGFGLSVYQSSNLTEEEALQKALNESIQDNHSSSDEDILGPTQQQRNRQNKYAPPHAQFSLPTDDLFVPRQPMYGMQTQDDLTGVGQRKRFHPPQPDSNSDSGEDDLLERIADVEPGYGSPYGGPRAPPSRRERRHEHNYSGFERYRPRSFEGRTSNQRGEDPTYGRGRADRELNYSITIHGTKVVLQRGQIAKFKADCLVNIVGPALKLDEGTVSKTFQQVGGPQLDALFQGSIQSQPGVSAGTAMVLYTQCRSCRSLRCQSVCHVVLQKGVDSCSQVVQNVMSQVLTNCLNQGDQSVAFPPLGVGRMYQYEETAVAKAMLQGVANFLSQQRLNTVTFVIYDKDDMVFAKFKREFQIWKTKQPNSLVPQFHSPATAANPINVPARPANLIHSPATPANHHQNLLKQMLAQQRVINAFQSPARPKSAHPKPSHGSPRRAPRRDKTEEIYNRRSAPADRARDGSRAESKDKGMKRESRFPKDAPAKKLTVDVVAENKDKCLTARNALGNAIKVEFLFEENMKKLGKVSREAKGKIIDVLTKHKVKSIPGKDGYIIRGRKDAVNLAIREIYQVLLDCGGTSESAVQEKRQRRKDTQRETTEYAKLMVVEEPDVPQYWKNFKPGSPVKSAVTEFFNLKLKGKRYFKEKLNSADQIYNCILQLINMTWDASTRGQGQDARGLDQLSYSRMNVTRIERIENLDLYHEYALKRVKVFASLLQKGQARFPEIHKLPGCTGRIKSVQNTDKCMLKDMNTEINEFYFFHGTKPENVSVICDQGLDNRLASGSAMFGQGIYGAETPSKADQYADDKGKRTAGQGQSKQMFLMRIILGNAFVCTDHNPHKFRRPPCVTCLRDDCRDKHQGLFDSVVGDNKKLFREFVVYDKALCYPEYLITYERL